MKFCSKCGSPVGSEGGFTGGTYTMFKGSFLCRPCWEKVEDKK